MDHATAGNAGRPSRSALFWSLIVAVGYLIINAAVLVVEYISEMSKLHRGFFTDTFSPFVYTNILTFPTSAIHTAWSGYPFEFDFGVARKLVRDAVIPLVVNIVIQTILVAVLVSILVRWRRRSEQLRGCRRFHNQRRLDGRRTRHRPGA